MLKIAAACCLGTLLVISASMIRMDARITRAGIEDVLRVMKEIGWVARR